MQFFISMTLNCEDDMTDVGATMGCPCVEALDVPSLRYQSNQSPQLSGIWQTNA